MNFMAIHPTVVEVFQFGPKWRTDQPTLPREPCRQYGKKLNSAVQHSVGCSHMPKLRHRKESFSSSHNTRQLLHNSITPGVVIKTKHILQLIKLINCNLRMGNVPDPQ